MESDSDQHDCPGQRCVAVSCQPGERISPEQVRATTFGSRWRGLDPDEVYGYLRRLADELDVVLRAETTAHTEAERIRQGLRQWQAWHARCWFVGPDRRTPNRGPW